MPSRPVQARCLAAAGQHGSYHAAGAELAMGAAAVERSVESLEGELGVQLLEQRPDRLVLTPAGRAYLERAEEAMSVEAEAGRIAAQAARGASGRLDVGFVGPPPAATMPELFDRFARERPGVTVTFRDIPFPSGTTGEWLGDVDAAVCHAPASDAGVVITLLREERRVLVISREHRLAGRGELNVADVLDETFVGYHPRVQAGWAAFHSFDDHRGGPPRALTDHHPLTTLQMLGAIAQPDVLAVAPECDALIGVRAVTTMVAVPVRDAAPVRLSLISRADSPNPLLADLLEVAGEVYGGRGV